MLGKQVAVLHEGGRGTLRLEWIEGHRRLLDARVFGPDGRPTKAGLRRTPGQWRELFEVVLDALEADEHGPVQ